jgi:hypothetical protein
MLVPICEGVPSTGSDATFPRGPFDLTSIAIGPCTARAYHAVLGLGGGDGTAVFVRKASASLKGVAADRANPDAPPEVAAS